MELIKQFQPLDGAQLKILDQAGEIIDEKLDPKLSDDLLKKIYRTMVLARTADQKAFKLQRSGKMGTFAQVKGQEAQAVLGFLLEKKDWMFPAFRELAAELAFGMDLEKFYLLYMGNEKGCQAQEGLNLFPVSVPVASQVVHAVGCAWASKIKKDPIVTMGFLGDGATSEGDFHEAMNFAGVFQTPTVIICQNNQFAISTRHVQQTAAKTYAQKAIAYGFSGIQVDGNDILAVYAAAKEAVDRARSGGGPTLIEMYMYRLADHTTSDDASIYRDDAELQEWEAKDPLIRTKKYLQKKNLLTEDEEDKMLKEIDEEVSAAIAKTIKDKKTTHEEMFKYMYADMPQQLVEQLADAQQFSAYHKD